MFAGKNNVNPSIYFVKEIFLSFKDKRVSIETQNMRYFAQVHDQSVDNRHLYLGMFKDPLEV